MRIAMLVISLYVITAYLGLQLAIPAGYATAIWAPAGIALGAVLVWGLRSLSSIFIGSLIINFYISYPNTSFGLALAIASLIATGATLQALFGWWLIKSFFGLNKKLIHPKDILLFAFLSSLVACSINATWSVVTLHFLNLLSTKNITLSWMTWWTGDSIGALLVTPIFLIYFKKLIMTWNGRVIQRILPLCLSFVAFIFIYTIVIKTEINRVNMQFESMNKDIIDKFEDQLKISINSAYSLTTHLRVSPQITNATFTAYAQSVVARQGSMQILEWVPEVHDKSAFETQYGIPIVTKKETAFVPVTQRPVYYPILYIEPLADNEKAIGYDLSSEPQRAKALQEAKQQNKMIVSAPIQLIQNTENDIGVLLISPVYSHKYNKLHGFSLIALNLTKLSRQIFNNMNDFYKFSIVDSTNAKEIFSYKDDQSKIQNPKYSLIFHKNIKIGNSIWTVSSISSINYINRAFSWQVWSILPGGFLFCILMNIILLILYGQESLIQIKVMEQTSKLQIEEAKNLLVLNSAGEGILELDINGKISFSNPAAQNLLGYSKQELATKTLNDLSCNNETSKKKATSIQSSIQQNKLHIDGIFFRKNGRGFAVEYSSTPIKKNNKIIGAVVVFNNVTERRENQMKIEKMARHDMLTGLPNRFSFMGHLSQALARAKRNNSIMAVCFIDIDNFKQINDNYGHLVGDKLLKLIPKLLLPRLRSIDFLARLGGDEFGLILENIKHISEIDAIAANYIKIASNPLNILNNEINTSVSIGIANYPEDGTNAEGLIRNADIAMYHAKEEGKNTYAFFSEEMNTLMKRRHQIDVALRRALEHHEFHLVYQPQLDTISHVLAGVEVLLRMESSTLMTVMPAEFIPVAENNGMIHEIGYWVLEQVAKEYHQLMEHAPSLKITINTSIKQLENPLFGDSIGKLMNQYKINPQHLYFEVTETALMKNPDRTLKIMCQLEEKGIRFALDDFGMGYSSMYYLKKLPISIIKIDQSFVQDIAKDASDSAIVNAIIKLAHGLNIITVAEGVENKEQLDYLKSCDCDQVQGFYLAKPMSRDQLISWMIKNTKE